MSSPTNPASGYLHAWSSQTPEQLYSQLNPKPSDKHEALFSHEAYIVVLAASQITKTPWSKSNNVRPLEPKDFFAKARVKRNSHCFNTKHEGDIKHLKALPACAHTLTLHRAFSLVVQDLLNQCRLAHGQDDSIDELEATILEMLAQLRYQAHDKQLIKNLSMSLEELEQQLKRTYPDHGHVGSVWRALKNLCTHTCKNLKKDPHWDLDFTIHEIEYWSNEKNQAGTDVFTVDIQVPASVADIHAVWHLLQRQLSLSVTKIFPICIKLLECGAKELSHSDARFDCRLNSKIKKLKSFQRELKDHVRGLSNQSLSMTYNKEVIQRGNALVTFGLRLQAEFVSRVSTSLSQVLSSDIQPDDLSDEDKQAALAMAKKRADYLHRVHLLLDAHVLCTLASNLGRVLNSWLISVKQQEVHRAYVKQMEKSKKAMAELLADAQKPKKGRRRGKRKPAKAKRKPSRKVVDQSKAKAQPTARRKRSTQSTAKVTSAPRVERVQPIFLSDLQTGKSPQAQQIARQADFALQMLSACSASLNLKPVTRRRVVYHQCHLALESLLNHRLLKESPTSPALTSHNLWLKFNHLRDTKDVDEALCKRLYNASFWTRFTIAEQHTFQNAFSIYGRDMPEILVDLSRPESERSKRLGAFAERTRQVCSGLFKSMTQHAHSKVESRKHKAGDFEKPNAQKLVRKLKKKKGLHYQQARLDLSSALDCLEALHSEGDTHTHALLVTHCIGFMYGMVESTLRGRYLEKTQKEWSHKHVLRPLLQELSVDQAVMDKIDAILKRAEHTSRYPYAGKGVERGALDSIQRNAISKLYTPDDFQLVGNAHGRVLEQKATRIDEQRTELNQRMNELLKLMPQLLS